MQCAGTCLATDSSRQTFTDGEQPIDWTLYDGNGDGLPDVLIVDLGTESAYFHAGDGDGGFAVAVTVAVGRTQPGLAVADFTGDGVLDVLLRQPDFGRARLLAGGAAGPFVRRDVSIASDAYRLLSHDIDADGAIDIAVVRANTGCIDALLNDGQGGFPSPPIPCIALPYGVAWRWADRGADVDGDGRSEVIGIPVNSGSIVAFDLDAHQRDAREVARWSVPSTVAQPVVGDVLGSPGLELVALPQPGYSEAFVFEAHAGATTPACSGVQVPSFLDTLHAGDVDRDGLPDFLAIAPSAAYFVVSRSRPVPPVLE